MSSTSTLDSTVAPTRAAVRSSVAVTAGRPVRPEHRGRRGRPVRSTRRAHTAQPPRRAVRPTVVAPVSRRHLRLTRRGRLVLVGLVAVLLFAAFSYGRVGADGSTTALPQPAPEQATVQAGDTLWTVAQRLAPGRDPRPVVEQLRRLNHLDGVGLQAGQQLLLPRAS
jgi:hypothetical protein